MSKEQDIGITAKIEMLPDKTCHSQIGVRGTTKDLIILSYMLIDGIAEQIDLDIDVMIKLYGDFTRMLKRYNGEIKTTIDVKEFLRQLGRAMDDE